MTVATRPPVREVDTFRDRFNRMLAEFDSLPFELWERLPVPIDLQETEDRIVVKATLPGIKAEDIEIDVRDQTLYLRGESREEREEKEGTWHRRERRLGRVERSMTLPATVDPGQTDALLTDGVLTVTLVKQEPSAGRKITVRTQ